MQAWPRDRLLSNVPPRSGLLSLAVGFGKSTTSSKARQESVFQVDDGGSDLIIGGKQVIIIQLDF